MGEGPLDRYLREFGFSEKEIAVYRTVLDLGEAKPSEIASAADVSNRYAYEVGERLERRGFLVVHDHLTPTIIRARPPAEVIDGLEAELAGLGPVLHERYQAPDQGQVEVQVIKTRNTLQRRMRELIDSAEREVDLAMPPAVIDDVAEELVDARERGVLVIMVIGDEGEAPDVGDLADVARIGQFGQTGLLSIDMSTTVVASETMLTRTNTPERAIACFDDRLSRLICSGFTGNIWMLANEHHCTDPRALPATFEYFRTGVLHAALHRRAGADLSATVRGYRSSSGDSVTLDGEVTAVKQSLIDPATSDFPGEHGLAIETSDGPVSVGGAKAVLEDVRAEELTLRRG